MNPKPEILWQTPHSFQDVLVTSCLLGAKTGTDERARKLVEEMRQRVEKVSSLTAKLSPVRVFFLEWVDPVYCGGHWVPQMLQWAGGVDGISRSGVDSVRIAWEEVVRFNPEVLIVSPCGFSTKDALQQADLLKSRPGFGDLAAVKAGRVYAVDANAYFAKPGPRLADGVELLAHLIHPKLFSWEGPARAAFAKSLRNSHGIPKTPDHPLHCRPFQPGPQGISRALKGPFHRANRGCPHHPQIPPGALVQRGRAGSGPQSSRHPPCFHLPELGGLMHAKKAMTPRNLGWKNESFRGFADYMGTPGFETGLGKLNAMLSDLKTAVMCAEAVPWRCHRSLISDVEVSRGIAVELLMSPTSKNPHEMTSFAVVDKKSKPPKVSYPAPPEEKAQPTLPGMPPAASKKNSSKK